MATAALSGLVRAWQDSLQYGGTEPIRELFHGDAPGSLILLWHNRLFPCIGALMRTGMGRRRLYALVSASRDGARLVHYLEAQGILPIRGSSSRRGAVATRELFNVLGDGHHVAITVDGPRGPCYEAQAGAALLAQLTGAPLCLFNAECETCWELPSWDRFLVPRPFSRVSVRMHRLSSADVLNGREARQVLQARIQAGLRAITRDTHRWL